MTFSLSSGTAPLLISLPHVGTEIPDELRDRYVPRALAVEDTDWCLDRLYEFASELGASFLVPRLSRYVVDLNRPSDDTPMYPAANNTELCPTRSFAGAPLYRDGAEPGASEVVRRVERWWRPYHEALAGEIERLRSTHGYAIVFDGHSIGSELPWLFEGTLPHLNLGTAEGQSCAGSMRVALAAVLAADGSYTSVVDGRFKGGFITRHYGHPEAGVHAVQLELSYRTYMVEEPTPAWSDQVARAATPLLRRLLETLLEWRPE